MIVLSVNLTSSECISRGNQNPNGPVTVSLLNLYNPMSELLSN